MRVVSFSPQRSLSIMLLMIAVLFLSGTAFSATYYVAKTGSNSNSGSQTRPWLTIQKAADSVSAGDTVIVGPGTYAEMVTSEANGSANNYITFQAATPGTVKVYKFELDHSYNKVTGFQVTGYKNNNSELFLVEDGGDYCIVENNFIGPGVGCFLEDVSSNSSARRLSSDSASFVSDGFAVGDELCVEFHSGEGYGSFSESRATITALTETAMTLNCPVPDASGLTVLFAVQVRGLTVSDGSTNCIIRNNTFSDTWHNQLHLFGSNHLVERNEFRNSNYYDVTHLFGHNNLIRYNYIHDVQGGFPNKHTDVVQMFGPNDSYENVFEYNFILNANAQFFMVTTINADIRDWTIRNNVIANQEGHDAPSSNIYGKNFTIVNNTFYRGSPRLGHPIYVRSDGTKGSADNMVVKNNIFSRCGTGDHTSPDNYGWYAVADGVDNFQGDYNYVGGAPTTYPYKPNFDEDHGINGGNPMFQNAENPLGPDGIPFTADDGLILRDGSPLLGKGQGGVDMGAYPRSETPVPNPPENLRIRE